MKKLILIVCLWPLFLEAQHDTDVVVNFTGSKMFTITKTVENKTDSLQKFFLGPFTNDSDFIDYMMSKVTASLSDTESVKEQLLFIVADLIKSDRFRNDALSFRDWNDTAILRKEMSLMGFYYAVTTTQCGQFQQHNATPFIKSGYFKVDDFHALSVPGHSICEVKLRGVYVFVDFDPGEPCFMHWNPYQSRWATIYELRADTGLITVPYMYQGKILADWLSLPQYGELISRSPLLVGPMTLVDPIEITSEVIIPSHAKITTDTVGPFIFFDTTDVTTKALLQEGFDWMDQAETNHCYPCLDSAAKKVSEILGVPFSFQNRDAYAVFYNPVLDQGKPIGSLLDRSYQFQRGIIPSWIFHIQKEDDDTLTLGSEFKAPMIFLERSGSGDAQVGDYSFSGNAWLHLWDPDTVQIIPSEHLNYIQEGFFSAHEPQTVKVAVNGNILLPFNKWDIIGGKDLSFSSNVMFRNGTGTSLPITLTDFTATPIRDECIRLQWETAIEMDNSHFVILRSTDGVSFQEIGKYAGFGTSTQKHDYFYDDYGVEKNTLYYYQLKQVDNDGDTQLSKIVTAQLLSDDKEVVSRYYTPLGQEVSKETSGLKILITTTGNEVIRSLVSH